MNDLTIAERAIADAMVAVVRNQRPVAPIVADHVGACWPLYNFRVYLVCGTSSDVEIGIVENGKPGRITQIMVVTHPVLADAVREAVNRELQPWVEVLTSPSNPA